MRNEIVYLETSAQNTKSIRLVKTCCKELWQILSQENFIKKDFKYIEIVRTKQQVLYVCMWEWSVNIQELINSCKKMQPSLWDIKFEKITIPWDYVPHRNYWKKWKRWITNTKQQQYFKRQLKRAWKR